MFTLPSLAALSHFNLTARSFMDLRFMSPLAAVVMEWDRENPSCADGWEIGPHTYSVYCTSLRATAATTVDDIADDCDGGTATGNRCADPEWVWGSAPDAGCTA